MTVGGRRNKTGTGKTDLCLCSGTSITGARSPGTPGPKIGARTKIAVGKWSGLERVRAAPGRAGPKRYWGIELKTRCEQRK
jgi:hypothetical protein